ncbi:methylglutaconyl-CoA hydratase, mitochondrial-like [Clytia hemisphaerica]|uniref:Uncharacterized protein n=1 Tax=Clytia hemisphaerica TaxID=252671 RepID=A0A7M5V1W4_9CNID|eukprot:TCONS_00007633-protein
MLQTIRTINSVNKRALLNCGVKFAGFSTTTDVDLKDELRLEYQNDGGIAVVSLNRPAAKNALSINLMALFENYMNELASNRNVRAVVLRSLVPGVFCAGADLKERRKMTEADVPMFVSRARMLFQKLNDLPVPTIAALEGAALGGGLEMALSCDFRIASTTAKLGLPETKLAIIPGAGGTVRLPRLIGVSKAKELIFTGRVLNSTQAADISLVEYSVDQNDNGDAAFVRAMELAGEMQSQGPVALRAAKKSISRGIEVDLHSALTYEELCYSQVVPTKDRIEGLTAFKEKRKPVYKGE